MSAVDKLLDVARAEIGYIEKRTNANLDNKTANAGTANWTKYARDMAQISGWYNGNKNGYAWCDVFVDWCFVKAFGVEAAKKLINNGPCGAGCSFSADYYRQMGRFYTTNPQPGDQIFYGKAGDESHTGIVESVTASQVITIEGNTSGGNTTNGDRVARKTRSKNDSWIVGYGRPKWDVVANVSYEPPKQETPSSEYETYTVQSGDSLWAIGQKFGVNYLDIAKLNGISSPYIIYKGNVLKIKKKTTTSSGSNTSTGGSKTVNVSLEYLSKGDNGAQVKALQMLLVGNGYSTNGVDGVFGSGTHNAVIKYQRSKGLSPDGVCGPATWNKLLKG